MVRAVNPILLSQKLMSRAQDTQGLEAVERSLCEEGPTLTRRIQLSTCRKPTKWGQAVCGFEATALSQVGRNLRLRLEIPTGSGHTRAASNQSVRSSSMTRRIQRSQSPRPTTRSPNKSYQMPTSPIQAGSGTAATTAVQDLQNRG